MREKHLPQLAVNRLLAHLRGDSHILERQPLQEHRPFFIHRQADQRRAQPGDVQPVFFGEQIAVARAARRGITHAAGRDDHALGAQRAALRQLHVKAALRLPHMGDLRVQRNHNARIPHPAIQRARHVARLVALREDAAAALNLGRRAEHLQQPGHILVRKLARCRVQKTRISRNLLKEIVDIRNVGHVAAPLARNVNLLAQFFVFFKQRHARARPSGLQRGHHTRRAAADHGNVTRGLCRHRPCIHPKFLPSSGNAR